MRIASGSRPSGNDTILPVSCSHVDPFIQWGLIAPPIDSHPEWIWIEFRP